MKSFALAALGAVTMSLAMPAIAQDYPLKSGDHWVVQRVKIDDGHSSDYAEYLAGPWRKSMDWQVAKGYIKGYRILSNVNPRDGEADTILVTIFDRMPTNAESDARSAALNTYLATSDKAQDTASGERAKYRKRAGSTLYQEQLFKK